jgi:SAM-dependent MidA family methyltransferase
MRNSSVGSTSKGLVFLALALFCASGLVFQFQAQDSKDRALRNGWEVHRELTLAPETHTAVKDYFQQFLEYQDMVMFHPKLGYYSSGRVSFTDDYQTFPIVLAPLFGHMVAEQIFHMWEGMRKAGTLDEKEQFTIAEFGPGDGALAESILEYLEQQAKADPNWRQFANQVLYICYDRSPALNDIQRERNKRFGSRFAARVADATNPTATIPPGSLKGVVLSNELPDAFSVHKTMLLPSGAAEVAFVVPSLQGKSWQTIRPLVSAEVARAVEAGDLAVEKRFFSGKADAQVYLTKTTLVSLLENLLPKKEYEDAAYALEFQEVYVPASVIPELAAHLRRYAPVYAGVLARNPRGLVTYINLGAESFIQGSAQVLKAGYMLTIDYGTNWNGILTQDSVHFRTYGPARREANRIVQQDDANALANDQDASDPYVGPTLNDMTTDVNFSLLAEEGSLVGLKPIFYGSQKALQTGTTVSLEILPPNSKWAGKFHSWASDFTMPSVYKVFVQQKEGTDPAYRFPDQDPESLSLDQSELTDAQRVRAAEIEKRLMGN